MAGVNFPQATVSGAILSCGTAQDVLTGTTAETVAMLINPTADNDGGSTNRIFSRYATGSGSGGFEEVDGSGTAAIELLKVAGGGNMQVKTANNTLPLGVLHAVVVTTDNSLTATNTHFYIDSSSETTYQQQTSGSGAVGSLTGTTVYIGNRGDNTRPAAGILYQLAVWNIQLTAADITSYMNYSNPQTIEPGHLVRWYSLNECADGYSCAVTTFVDHGSSAQNCTAANATVGVANPGSSISTGNLYAAHVY